MGGPSIPENIEVAEKRGWEEEEGEKAGWWPVTLTALTAFWNYFRTPLGFCVTIYMLNGLFSPSGRERG